jgi:phosphoglycolate phosphatase
VPIPETSPAAIVFDLDGTLIDSLGDIASALNARLKLLGLPQRNLTELRYMVGEGFPRLCERAIGETAPELVPRLIELARVHYRTRLVEESHPYAGIRELIDSLAETDIPLCVLSNKPHPLTERIVKILWPEQPFRLVFGHGTRFERKPDPGRLLQICTDLGVALQQTWMVGDTPTDILTAQAAGTIGIGVTWGFRTSDELVASGAQYIVEHPSELNPRR